MKATQGDLRVLRTRSGYVAVLRVQGSNGVAVGFEHRVSDDEARALVQQLPGVGAFSFAKLAKSIGRAASKIAKSKVFKTFISAAQFLPAPISSVAKAADGAAKVLLAMRKKGDRKALAEWRRAAAVATADPTSPIAAGMRLAMDAVGRPRLAPPPAVTTAARDLVRELMERLDRERAAAPAEAPPADAPS